MSTLNQKITIEYDTGALVVVHDLDDEKADRATAAYAAGALTIDDIYGSLVSYAIVEVTVAGDTTTYRGQQVMESSPLADLDLGAPVQVTFTDVLLHVSPLEIV